MEERRPKSRLTAALMLVVALIGLPLALYVTGYFLLGPGKTNEDDGGYRHRHFKRSWLCTLYHPAAN